MPTNLQLEQGLNSAAQLVSDEAGNTCTLALSTGRVGVGTTNPTRQLDVQGGQVRIVNQGEGAVVLELSIERSWFFRQVGTGAGTALELASVGGSGNKNFIINTAGRVGIGTTSPQEKLEVNGNILATGDVILSGADCAEDFAIVDGAAVEPGNVMIVTDEGHLRQSSEAYDRKVAGVVSGAGDYRPGLILGRQKDQSADERAAIALIGRVYCKVDADPGAIAVGDLLTTSPTPGHAMKATDPVRAFGAVLGKALKPLNEGRGLIPVMVALQ